MQATIVTESLCCDGSFSILRAPISRIKVGDARGQSHLPSFEFTLTLILKESILYHFKIH